MPTAKAIVTRGSRGLGRNTVLSLAKKGVHSIFTYNSNRAEADKVVDAVREAGVKAVALRLDTDIGPMIASLLSEDNRSVNGQRIEVSGGMVL